MNEMLDIPLRKIIHVDMDAFYASVEQRDNPELRGLPVIVGSPPEKRGVVSTCSYEARRFGVHSAMASSRALELCPQALFLRPRFDAYLSVSKQVRRIFYDYTEIIEPLSLDEAYLDVTENPAGKISATETATEILSRIRKETGLPASAGVSYNKFLAKVASDYRKPNGLTVVSPEQAPRFLEKLPVRRFFGVGRVTEKRMAELGIYVGKDLLRFSRQQLSRYFGKSGDCFYNIARGEDNRPVEVSRERKSIGREHTYPRDLVSSEYMLSQLRQIAAEVSRHLPGGGVSGRTVTLKIKYHDFQCITRSSSQEDPVFASEELYEIASRLFLKTEANTGRKVRLLGISLSNLVPQDAISAAKQQLKFSFMERKSQNIG